MPPPFATDYWRRQDEHIARSLTRLRDDTPRTPPQSADTATESRHLVEAKASYDAMLGEMNAHDRALVERLMTSEMTMLMLAVTSAAGDLVIDSHQHRDRCTSRVLETSAR